MAYVTIPADLSKIKPKAIGNITRTQVKYIFLGAVFALPMFFVVKPILGIIPAIITVILLTFPFALAGFFEKNDQNLKQWFFIMLQYIRRSKTRIYKTNFYFKF